MGPARRRPETPPEGRSTACRKLSVIREHPLKEHGSERGREARAPRANSGGTTSPRPDTGSRVFVFPGTRAEGGAVTVATASATQLIPVRRERLADLETPVSAFAKL